MSVLPAKSLIQPFIDAGIVPPDCRRILIDIPADGCLMLHYEVYGDERATGVVNRIAADSAIAEILAKSAQKLP